ncbi:unnamed protein product [Rotaria magnacalcarata]|uniref:Uncharacterized protein n=1 Tax=Rotaria magnacalcarata TaxID=392030 RepID=A0A815I899_9BILA|nr:unnamed protein product [Rotaria magnacalcarata]
MDISYQKRICVRLILQIYIPCYHREESLDILVEFLLQHGYQKIQNIPIDIIRKLTFIVIKENVFVYEKKFYRQVIGAAMSSAFTLTLANIFMWK